VQPLEAVGVEVSIVVPSVLSNVVSSALGSSGIIPIVQLKKTAIPEKVRLPVNPRSLAGSELLFCRNQPAICTGTGVHPEVTCRASQPEHSYWPHAHGEVGCGVFKPIVAPLSLEGIGSGAIVVDPGIVAMDGMKIEEQMLAGQLRKGQLQDVFLVQ